MRLITDFHSNSGTYPSFSYGSIYNSTWFGDNVLIVIVQKNDKISFGKLEDNKFAMVFTGVSFIVLNALIVIL